MVFRLIWLLPLFLLSGCGLYSSQFDCPAGSGERCTSISDVNSLVDKGAVPKKKPVKRRKKRSGFSLFGKKLPVFQPSKPQLVRSSDSIYRAPEKTLRILVAAYESESGDHLEERFIHTVVQPARWANLDTSGGENAE